MKPPRKWSIGTLLLWTLVFGLVTSHVVNNWPKKLKAFEAVITSQTELEQMVISLDPMTKVWRSSYTSGSFSGPTVTSENGGVFETETSDSDAVLAQIQTQLSEKLREAGWKRRRRSIGDDQYNARFAKDDRVFHVYLWKIPIESNNFYRELESKGKTLTNIRLLQIGHYSP